MRHTMDEVRLCLDICNDHLEALGIPERLSIQTAYGKRRLLLGQWTTGAPGTPSELYRVLDTVSDVLHLVRKARG